MISNQSFFGPSAQREHVCAYHASSALKNENVEFMAVPLKFMNGQRARAHTETRWTGLACTQIFEYILASFIVALNLQIVARIKAEASGMLGSWHTTTG